MSNQFDGRNVGARACIVGDSSRRGVLESQGSKGFWAVRFTDKSRNIHVTDLKLLSSDAASFEPSQAPLSTRERQSSAKVSLNRGMSVAASTQCVR